MSTPSLTYYDRIIGHVGASFANLEYQKLLEKTSNSTEGSTKKSFSAPKIEKREKEVNTISSHASRYQQLSGYPAPACHISSPSPPYHAMHHPQPIYYTQQQYPSNQSHNQRQQNRQQGHTQWNSTKAVRNFTPLLELLVEVYQKLLSTNLITWIQPKSLASPLPKNYYQCPLRQPHGRPREWYQ